MPDMVNILKLDLTSAYIVHNPLVSFCRYFLQKLEVTAHVTHRFSFLWKQALFITQYGKETRRKTTPSIIAQNQINLCKH